MQVSPSTSVDFGLGPLHELLLGAAPQKTVLSEQILLYDWVARVLLKLHVRVVIAAFSLRVADLRSLLSRSFVYRPRKGAYYSCITHL